MNRITLTHVSLVASHGVQSEIEFDPSFTLIHGPSETGKSFIFETMDYVLGATELRRVKELDGYSHALLGFTTSSSDSFTLCRELDSGVITLFTGLHHRPPDEPGITLKQKHRHEDSQTLSGFMLQMSDLSAWSIYKASTGETTSLSFREVSHLLFAPETKMQSRISPFESGTPSSAPKERSLVRCLLAGQSDPPPARASKATKEVKLGQLELIARVLRTITGDEGEADTGDDLFRAAEKRDLSEQLNRLEGSIATASAPLATVSDKRDQVNSSLRERTRNLQSVIQRSDELSELSARFQLLEAQYVSDLERLEMIEEAGWVLAQETTQVCPMCGTDLSAQNEGAHREAEASRLFESVRTERERISGLLRGLRRTLTDIGNDMERLAHLRSATESRVAKLRETLRAVDAESSIKLRDFEQLQQKKSEVRRRLDVLNQIGELDRIRDEVVNDGQESAFEMPKVPTAELRRFESEIGSVLEAWNVEGASQTFLDPKSLELSVGGKARRDRGKGMRAVLNAASLLGLAQYCLQNDLPHPGFVVLDSPLVTYKDPKNVPNLEDEAIPDTVVQAFYKYLDTRFLGQCVVMENTEPEGAVLAGKIIEFTGTSYERQGFVLPALGFS